VFTGGVGEGSATVRELTADGLAFLGVVLDPERNASVGAAADTDISAAGSSAATLVITAREDLEIARQVRTLLSR
jgi:acetate kinase